MIFFFSLKNCFVYFVRFKQDIADVEKILVMTKTEEDLNFIHEYVTQNLIKLRGIESEQIFLWNDLFEHAKEIRTESLHRLETNE